MYTSLLLLLAGSGSDSALDANTTERIGPSSRVLPRCNVHVFEPVHKTSTKSRQGAGRFDRVSVRRVQQNCSARQLNAAIQAGPTGSSSDPISPFETLIGTQPYES